MILSFQIFAGQQKMGEQPSTRYGGAGFLIQLVKYFTVMAGNIRYFNAFEVATKKKNCLYRS